MKHLSQSEISLLQTDLHDTTNKMHNTFMLITRMDICSTEELKTLDGIIDQYNVLKNKINDRVDKIKL